MCPGETAATDAQWGDRAVERQHRDWMGLRWLVCSCVRVHDQQAHLAWRLSRGKYKMHEERRWFAGIDWASQEHVVIETPHGPIVEALLERGFNVYSINPKQLDRFRDRFTVAGSKDDSLDAYVLA